MAAAVDSTPAVAAGLVKGSDDFHQHPSNPPASKLDDANGKRMWSGVGDNEVPEQPMLPLFLHCERC